MSKSLKILLITAGVAIVLTTGLLLLIFLPNNNKLEVEDTNAEITVGVDENGVHTAEVRKNDKGEIEKNGKGTLVDYVPAKIKQIDIENQSGTYTVTSYTPTTVETSSGATETKTEATVYTLVGYEDFELQKGKTDDIANDAASMEFTKIAQLNCKNLKDFGLDKPVAQVKVMYTDDTSALFYVGSNAPGDTGTYVKFGDSDTVYLVDSDSVDGFLINLLDMFSLEINKSVTDDDNANPSQIKLSGKAYGDDIILKPNNSKEVSSSYIIASNDNLYASETEAALVTGTIRGLYAQSVVCVNPSDSQLEQYGLKTPYAALEATYPDTTIKLYSSKVSDDGTVFLTDDNKKLIYQIASSSVSWVVTSGEKLINENLFVPAYDYLSAITVELDGKKYKFDISKTTEQQEDEDGNTTDVDVYEITCDGKSIDSTNFRVFYQNLTSLKNKGATSKKGSNQELAVTYSYSTGRNDDTLALYKAGDDLTATLNGKILGLASSNTPTKIKQNIDDLLNGKTVANFS